MILIRSWLFAGVVEDQAGAAVPRCRGAAVPGLSAVELVTEFGDCRVFRLRGLQIQGDHEVSGFGVIDVAGLVGCLAR
ncbi:hypothetical protein CVS27_03325 [Arthrobacter glacialis]|uniref:Uncharacterized protein n=1 Tax=Arthrobacter glacialis TaxID=1664 RepID=A0A2S4A1B1_ARTGL|nr:hypothetical protein CVS27_03325 [Arthrobacter glacialis]